MKYLKTKNKKRSDIGQLNNEHNPLNKSRCKILTK